MRYLVLCFFSVSLLFATAYEGTTEDLGIEIEARSTISSELLDNPDGVQYLPTPEPLDPATLADPNDPSSAFEYQTPLERALSHTEEGPVWSGYDWADDVLIYGGQVGSGQDFDYDEVTGYLYAVYDTDHTSGDTLVCMRSMDHGLTWSEFGIATNSDNAISNPKVVVARAGGQTWIVIGGIWTETGDDTFWTRRFDTGGTGTFEQVAADVEWMDMAGDIGTGAYVYATWVPLGSDDVWAGRNALGGAGWVNATDLFDNTLGTSYPAIAAGAGGTVAVAFIDDRMTTNQQVRIKRSTTYGSSWLGSAAVSNAAADVLRECDIAFNHEVTQTGWITVTYDFSGADNCGFYYTTDSGANWTYGTTFPGSGGDENLSRLGAMKSTSSGGVTFCYNSDPGDSVMFSWFSPSSPETFTAPVRINDFAATGNWPAAAGWNGNNFSSILYTNWNNNYRLMYDWYNHTTGMDDATAGISMLSNAPNPFNATTNISFTLTQSSPVTIAVYNMAGQLVSTVADNQSFTEGSHSVQWDGQSLSPGVYFCRLSADGISQTHRMLLVK
jgi:hypothetical protein